MNLRQHVYHVLEGGGPDRPARIIFDWIMVILIIANVAAAAVETVEPIKRRFGFQLAAFELFSIAIFTIEYLARLWVAPEHLHLQARGPLGARLRFACSPFALIDLLAILPFYLSLLFPAIDLRALRVFRLLRLLKLARYSPALATLGRVLADERRALGAALLIMLGLLTLASTVMYHIERHHQPGAFGSIPETMWWALATLTTVGYGDIVPISPAGKLVGGIVMIFGLGMFALPIGIIASGFASEIHRRDFVVTWGMVARVPLFADLDALSVSRITNLLRARVVPPGTVIIRRGQEADALYFIASGQVEVERSPEPVRLSDGDFFGEIALLTGGTRTATVRAVTRCRLLVLEASDFHDLIEADGELQKAISTVAEERMA